MSYNNNNKKPIQKQFQRENKYDKSYNSSDRIQAQMSFQPNEKQLIKTEFLNDKIDNLNKEALPYYPLPSNEGYETFLKTMKKEQYTKSKYSLPFMLSLRQKYTERIPNMKEIKVPQKNEIRSRAKIVTEEAYRVTRNYLDENIDKRNFAISYTNSSVLSEEDIRVKTKQLREILNKICYDNYDHFLNQILKFEYDERLLDIFKNLIFTKTVTEQKYFSLYVNICLQMCKLYNKKTYSNEPKMNLKSLLLISIQKEFLSLEETSIAFPFTLTPEEKKSFINTIKKGNIKFISELYLNSTIPKKIISDCINELIKKDDTISVGILCELMLATYKKLIFDGKELLTLAIEYLEALYKKNTLPSKIKFLVMDVIDLKDKMVTDAKKEDISYETASLSAFPIRKNSEIRSRRKSSINPKDVEYIRRSRFNSRADELKGQKDDTPGLIDELVTCLGADIDFYHCFRLTEEEFNLIKEGTNIILTHYNSIKDSKIQEVLKTDFETMMDEVQCEKFIAVGHMLEIMFSMNVETSDKVMKLIVSFFNEKMIEEEDIKHGICLSLVNFKSNIIDYPNTKEYFQKFINIIKDNKIIEEKIFKVYQRCCDNMEKCFE